MTIDDDGSIPVGSYLADALRGAIDFETQLAHLAEVLTDPMEHRRPIPAVQAHIDRMIAEQHIKTREQTRAIADRELARLTFSPVSLWDGPAADARADLERYIATRLDDYLHNHPDVLP